MLVAITGLEYSVLNAYVKAGSVESSILQARGTCHDYPAWFQTVTDLDTFVGLHEKATIVFLEVDSFCSNFFYFLKLLAFFPFLNNINHKKESTFGFCNLHLAFVNEDKTLFQQPIAASVCLSTAKQRLKCPVECSGFYTA